MEYSGVSKDDVVNYIDQLQVTNDRYRKALAGLVKHLAEATTPCSEADCQYVLEAKAALAGDKEE
jgi:hypothetical protein